jgi:hypothetical protein
MLVLHNFLGKDEVFCFFLICTLKHLIQDAYIAFCSVSAQVGTTDSSGQVSGITNVASVFPPMASGDLLVGELATSTKVSNF